MNQRGGSRSKYLTILSVLCLLGLVGLLPASPLSGAETAMPKPAARDKCPVCGMFVAKYPDWLAVIRFRDGAHLFFDGPKDLFKYLHNQKKYDPARNQEDIQSIMVMDYYGLAVIDARKARFVLGSDVYGPMGRELIPLEKETDAREFLKDHKGQKIIRFSEATPEVIRTLD